MSHAASWRRLLSGVALLGAVCLPLLAAACGGADGSSGDEAEAVVVEFVEGWQRASGPQHDDSAAEAITRLLTGSLQEQATAAAAGAGPGLGALYSQFIGLDIPYDEGYEVLDVTSDGARVNVRVRMRYSTAAAGAAAAAGVIPFERVTEVHQQVTDDPTRVFTLQNVEGHWRIAAIEASTEGGASSS